MTEPLACPREQESPAYCSVSLALLGLRICLEAEAEALMEMNRCYFEKRSLTLLRRWGDEWLLRRANTAAQRSINRRSCEDSISVSLFALSELDSAFSWLNSAFDEYAAAIAAGNEPLILRWVEEWRRRRLHAQEVIRRQLPQLQSYFPDAWNSILPTAPRC